MAINENVKTLAGKIKDSLVIEGNVVNAEEGLYEKVLPETLTIEKVMEVRHHDASFVAASALAFGELSIEAMKKDNKLTEMLAGISMGGKDSVRHTMQKEKTFINQMGDGGEITKYGVCTTTLEMTAGKKVGELKKVRTELGEIAMKAFCK